MNQTMFKLVDDWYRFDPKNAISYNIKERLSNYNDSLYDALREAYPKTNWQFWRFKFREREERKLWNSSSTCREFLEWIQDKLEIDSTFDWYQIKESFIEEMGKLALRSVKEKHFIFALY
jgi:hypothetical protein